MSLRKAIVGVLPERLKAAIRPWLPTSTDRGLDRPSGVAIGTFGGFEIAYRKGTADEAVIRHSFDNDIFFSRVHEYQPNEGDVIIDIGAHIGTFSILAASKVRCGKVHAIEASEDSYHLLKINVALNRSENIAFHHLAITDTEGVCTLHHDIGNWGHSTVKRLSNSSERVQSCTLSTFLEKNQIAKCQFMKLNCEGGEFPIILGASRDALRRFGIILILYHCDLWSNNTERDLIAHLESCGFECAIRHHSTERGWIIAVNTQK
jgi:FkbM family methyltransferase